MAQLVKNPPAMWEIWVRSLGWEDPLEKGKATHPLHYSGLENSMDCIVLGVAKSWTRLSDFHSHIKQDLGRCSFLHNLFRDAFYTSMEIVVFFSV